MISDQLRAAAETVALRRGDWHAAIAELRAVARNAGIEIQRGHATRAAAAQALFDAGTRAGLNPDLVRSTIGSAFYHAALDREPS